MAPGGAEGNQVVSLFPAGTDTCLVWLASLGVRHQAPLVPLPPSSPSQLGGCRRMDHANAGSLAEESTNTFILALYSGFPEMGEILDRASRGNH